jgi:hypothetical protein
MFRLTTSCHNMPCIELYTTGNEHDEEIEFLLRAVRDNWSDSEYYQAKRDASPFVQGLDQREGNKFLLIEFWGHNIDEYVAFLNKKWRERNAIHSK